MIALLRVLLFEWILARIGLRWLLGLAAGGAAVLIFAIGLPTLLISGALLFLAWRWIRSLTRSPSASAEVPSR
ncbi:MAG: hypothetical protein K2X99_06765 [Gemmatimonadaceae bacterium]|nr:hypothetical protein [Gemmatimonadaceae bacterium]